MRSLLLGLGLLGAVAAHASPSSEYRVFTLADGRVLIAQVVATEGHGMRVRVPQGEITVPFAQLVDMVPVDREKYESQEDWSVYLAADATYRPGFAAAYRAIPHLTLLGDDVDDPLLTPEQAERAEDCGMDLECIVDSLAAVPGWVWVVVARMEGGDVRFDGAVSTGATRTLARAPRVELDAVNEAALDVIGLTPAPEPIATAAPVAARPPPRVTETSERDRVLHLSFVPVPGLPSLVQGDTASFGLAVATVAPVTALWVGASGRTAQSPAQHVLMGVGGFYAATVVANQLFGLHSLQRGGGSAVVGLHPTEEGGAAVQVTVRR